MRPAAAPHPARARIVIVGAGLAGLTAAYRLHQSGYESRVFDANVRVGGRTFTLRDPAFGGKVELGGELIDSGHAALLSLARELELSVVDLASDSAGLEQETYFVGEERYRLHEMVELFRPLAPPLLRDRSALGDTLSVTCWDASPRARELDRMSLSEWLEAHALDGPVRRLLEVAYTGEYGLEPDQQSCLNLLGLIGTDAGTFEIFGGSDERYTLREGNAALAERMAGALPSPVALGHVLLGVRERPDRSLRLTFARDRTLLEVDADQLVLALPFNQLRKVELGLALSPTKRQAIARLRYGTNAKLMLATASRPWREAGSSGTSFNDAVYHQTWDSARGQPGERAVLTSFSGGRLGLELGRGSAEEQALRLLERLERIYPGVQRAFTGAVARFHWPSAPYFEGSYACYGPGDCTSFGGSEALAEGNVYFCGEHTSRQAQGYMEGAVESGERVAAEIVRALRSHVLPQSQEAAALLR